MVSAIELALYCRAAAYPMQGECKVSAIELAHIAEPQPILCKVNTIILFLGSFLP